MQDEYLTVLYIKHFHSLRVDMSEHGHRMLIAQNPGVHLAHWYIINNSCKSSSKHTDVSPVELPCQCVYAHVCLCMWVSPAWVLGLCKVAKSASVPLNQVWQWIVVMFPGVCMIPAQWQPSFHTVESWFSCMWHGCINETLLHCTSLHECAVTRGTLSGQQQIHLDHQQPGQLAAIVWGSYECRDHQDRPFYLSHNIALRPLHICSVCSALLYSFPHQPYPGTFPDLS